ncbi:MAG: hypothetical protein ACYS8L_09890 [Planctomycetota bacterium]|jgi:hypothetical protein
MIDGDDTRAIATGVIRVLAVALLILIGAAIAGGALRVFQIVSGI